MRTVILLFLCVLAPVFAEEKSLSDMTRQEKDVPALFLQLGLPDTRGAKWVKVQPGNFTTFFLNDDLPVSDKNAFVGYSGNAWLLSEDENGIVELVIHQSQKIRARRIVPTQKRNLESGDHLHDVIIDPGDIDRDLDALRSAMPKSVLPNGHTFLFFVHLQNQGRMEAVRKLFPQLSIGSATTDILNQAVSAVADGRLTILNQQWSENGDVGAYSKGLEKLTIDFPRGWAKLDSVVSLLQVLSQQPPVEEINNPEAEKAAEVIMGLTLERLDRWRAEKEENWLLPRSHDFKLRINQRMGIPGSFGSSRWKMISQLPINGIESPNDDPLPENDPLMIFLAGKQKAAAGLLDLVDDHRLLKILREPVEEGKFDYYGDNMVEIQPMNIPRPFKLGEIARMLLDPVMPTGMKGMTSEFYRSGDYYPEATDWLKEVITLNDEELAWHILRRREVEHPQFKGSIRYLIQQGGSETLAKLKEVFVDPLVWSSFHYHVLLEVMDPFFKRLGSDTSEIQGKMIAAFKKALEREKKEWEEREKSDEDETPEKYDDAGALATLRIVEDAINRPRITDLLEAYVAADEQKTEEMWETINEVMKPASFQEVEKLVYLRTAKSHSEEERLRALDFLRYTGYGSLSMLPDQETRTALNALIKDPKFPVAIPPLLVGKRMTMIEDVQLEEVGEILPGLALDWIQKAGHALINGQQPPPIPDGSGIPFERVQEVAEEFAKLSPSQLPSAFASKSPKLQLALALNLKDLPKLSPLLHETRFIISRIREDVDRNFPLDQWKGRRLDETLILEAARAIQAAAKKGRYMSITFESLSLMEGVQVSVASNPDSTEVNSSPQCDFILDRNAGTFLRSDEEATVMNTVPISLDETAVSLPGEFERALIEFLNAKPNLQTTSAFRVCISSMPEE